MLPCVCTRFPQDVLADYFREFFCNLLSSQALFSIAAVCTRFLAHDLAADDCFVIVSKQNQTLPHLM